MSKFLIKYSWMLILVGIGLFTFGFIKGVNELTYPTNDDIAGMYTSHAQIDTTTIQVDWSLYNNNKFQWRMYTIDDTLTLHFFMLSQGRWNVTIDSLYMRYNNDAVDRAHISYTDSTLTLWFLGNSGETRLRKRY